MYVPHLNYDITFFFTGKFQVKMAPSFDNTWTVRQDSCAYINTLKPKLIFCYQETPTECPPQIE